MHCIQDFSTMPSFYLPWNATSRQQHHTKLLAICASDCELIIPKLGRVMGDICFTEAVWARPNLISSWAGKDFSSACWSTSHVLVTDSEDFASKIRYDSDECAIVHCMITIVDWILVYSTVLARTINYVCTQNMTQKLGQLLINEYMTHWRIDLTLLKALLTSKPSTNARNINSGTETIWYHCVLCPVQCRSLSMTKAGCNCAFRVLHQPIDLAINFLNWTIIHSTFNMDWVNPL